MSNKNIYALNKISGIVAQINSKLLDHPVLGKNLVQVDEPGVCITCGDQPDKVNSISGKSIETAKGSAKRKTRITEEALSIEHATEQENDGDK
jgi:hypothetical protein